MKYKYNGQWYDVAVKALDSMEIGCIIQFMGNTIPTGWLECDGSSITQSDYPELYALIGGTLPNFKGRVLVGQDTNDSDFDTLGETGGSKYLQEHNHRGINVDGIATGIKNGTASGIALNFEWTGRGSDIATNNAGTGNSGNLQPYAVVKHIIKAKNTTPTMASVINTHSNSTEDTYSCDYINGTTLYESTSGTTGNITLNDSLDNYKTIKIYTLNNEDSSSSLGIFEFDTSKTKFMLSGSGIGSTLSVYTKEYTKGTNELTSSTGKLYQVSSGSITNYEVFKVYKVVGYK